MYCYCTTKKLDDQVVEPKYSKNNKNITIPQNIVKESVPCKCNDIKDSKGRIVGKSCNKVLEKDDKIFYKKCCDASVYNEVVLNGKTQCVQKPPPTPVLVIVPQEERVPKGTKIKKSETTKKL